ncbi:MAG: septal ring lytic transglycosylase RlpA family protein [Chthoniobacteraceae bacterium]
MFTWIKRLFGMSDDLKVLKGNGTWGFVVLVDGNDLVVRGAKATWFGGANDPQDNGETASGVSTKKRPYILGCALPMNFGPCNGSPIPRVPWGTKVEVNHLASGKTITVPVIDLGPARGTGNAIDLTPAAFKQFASLAEGKIMVDYRIPGGAKYLTA